MLKESYSHYYTLKKQATDLQESLLLDLVAAKARLLGIYQNSIYNNLIEQER